jgi:predicted ribosome quality control (RQC) complex YloA/Tae2 family protein
MSKYSRKKQKWKASESIETTEGGRMEVFSEVFLNASFPIIFNRDENANETVVKLVMFSNAWSEMIA